MVLLNLSYIKHLNYLKLLNPILGEEKEDNRDSRLIKNDFKKLFKEFLHTTIAIN